MKETAIYDHIRAPRWGKEEREVQRCPPRKPYVYGTAGNNALIHVTNHIRLRWWVCGPSGAYLVRLQSPRMAAITNCGRYIRLHDTSGKVCTIPKPDAVMCAACLGKGRNFPRRKQHDIPMAIAKVRLGCVEAVRP